MTRPFHLCLALTFALMLLVPAASTAAEEYVLSISEDNYKVVFISGNLTAAATYSWPRVVFYHSYESFWPIFEVGFPRAYLFNDTDSDGRFEANETLFVGYMDEYHTTWSIAEPILDTDPALGQYADFGMKATVSLFSDPVNMTALVNDWSNITFWFRVVENGEVFSNSAGYYVVQGQIEMRINITIEVLNRTMCSGIVMEQVLKGGGTTEMFLLREIITPGEENLTMVSSRIDETAEGLNVTHHFRETPQPRQEARFARDDWTAQAFYFWNSDVNLTTEDKDRHWKGVNSTYFTTGTGLVLQSIYPAGNDTAVLSTDMSIGLYNPVYRVDARDWVKDNLVALTVTISSLVALIALLAALTRWRRLRKAARAPPHTGDEHGGREGP